MNFMFVRAGVLTGPSFPNDRWRNLHLRGTIYLREQACAAPRRERAKYRSVDCSRRRRNGVPQLTALFGHAGNCALVHAEPAHRIRTFHRPRRYGDADEHHSEIREDQDQDVREREKDFRHGACMTGRIGVLDLLENLPALS